MEHYYDDFGFRHLAEEIFFLGLRMFFSERKINSVKDDPVRSKTNRQRFKDHFGCPFFVAAKIWEDLQTTDFPEARIEFFDVKAFLQSLHFLCRYKRLSEMEGCFDKAKNTITKWNWYCLTKTQQLKRQKIVFPEDFGDDIWVMSVDGTHSVWNEPSHPQFSQDKKAFSFKKNHAGLCCELGIHLFESKLMWMNGAFYAGNNDKGNFVEGGLEDKLKSIGKKAVGDKGYTGHNDECGTWNAFDGDTIKKFKSRAQMRHEQFNGMIKEFSSLSDQFRHKHPKFEICFEAACVICQHRMENGEPLFDILAGLDEDDGEVYDICFGADEDTEPQVEE